MTRRLVSHAQPELPRECPGSTAGGAMLVVVGFQTAVGMWWLGYVTHLPALRDRLPGELILTLLLTLMILGGLGCGRAGGHGVWIGAGAGLLTAVINLMVFGSLLGETANPNQLRAEALLWIAGFLVAGAGLGAAGAWTGRVLPRRRPRPAIDWQRRFGHTAASATLLVLITGGVVTSDEAGMAFPDWPTSDGSFMFLYPLGKMVGGIYFEHAHRLFGSLVGVTILVWGIFLICRERRTALRVAAAGAFLLVCGQGVLGGSRVIAESVMLAALHGVTGQLVFGYIVAVAAVSSHAGETPTVASVQRVDRTMVKGFIALLVVQLILGAVVRHFGPEWVLLHIAGAVAVVFVMFVVGTRCVSLYGSVKPVWQAGVWLLVFGSSQLISGFLALYAVGFERSPEPATAFQIIVTTAHQANGALILASAVFLAVGLLRAADDRDRPPVTPAGKLRNGGAGFDRPP